MSIVVDETAFFLQSLFLEEKILKYGIFAYFYANNKKLLGVLKSLPYDVKLISYIDRKYKNQKINLLLPSSYNIYDLMIRKHLGDRYLNKIIYFKSIDEKNTLIKDFISQKIKLISDHYSSYGVLSKSYTIPTYLYRKFFQNKETLFYFYIYEIFLNIFDSLFFYIPIMYSWVLWLPKSYNISNSQYRISLGMLLCILNISHILRIFRVIDTQRKGHHDGYDPQIPQYILNKANYNILISRILIMILGLIYLSFKRPLSFIILIPVGVSYYIGMLMPRFMKYTTILMSLIPAQLLILYNI